MRETNLARKRERSTANRGRESMTVAGADEVQRIEGRISKFLGLWEDFKSMDLAPEIQDGFGPNPNPTLLTYPNKGFGFEPPQIQIQIYVIQTYY